MLRVENSPSDVSANTGDIAEVRPALFAAEERIGRTDDGAEIAAEGIFTVTQESFDVFEDDELGVDVVGKINELARESAARIAHSQTTASAAEGRAGRRSPQNIQLSAPVGAVDVEHVSEVRHLRPMVLQHRTRIAVDLREEDRLEVAERFPRQTNAFNARTDSRVADDVMARRGIVGDLERDVHRSDARTPLQSPGG
ncbi:hypothetical protein ASF31_05635 [Brevundimonas sp. Leaf280]|nr:hypothetical protein ASF31_05635 [Brevundimonas sp. Leaf280]